MKFISTLEDLRSLPGFMDGWQKCNVAMISFINERLIQRARSADVGAINELSKLLEDLRSIGAAETSPTQPPKPLMQPLHSMRPEDSKK